MTRKEAIKWLDTFKDHTGMTELSQAFDVAIESLKQEPCEEAISRQAVLSKIKEVCFSKEWGQFRVDNGSNGQRDFLINYIEQLPPATPQPKIGHWLPRNAFLVLYKSMIQMVVRISMKHLM